MGDSIVSMAELLFNRNSSITSVMSDLSVKFIQLRLACTVV
jgi:hypothetical protein